MMTYKTFIIIHGLDLIIILLCCYFSSYLMVVLNNLCLVKFETEELPLM